MASGGARAGAGRPKVAATVVKENELVERKLRAMAEEGWGVLADAYPELIRQAVVMAMGNEETKPDKSMMKTLVELMVKVVGSERDQNDTAIKQLVGSFFDRLSQSNRDGGPTLDGDGTGRNESADGRDVEGAEVDSTLPRVDVGIRLSRND